MVRISAYPQQWNDFKELAGISNFSRFFHLTNQKKFKESSSEFVVGLGKFTAIALMAYGTFKAISDLTAGEKIFDEILVTSEECKQIDSDKCYDFLIKYIETFPANPDKVCTKSPTEFCSKVLEEITNPNSEHYNEVKKQSIDYYCTEGNVNPTCKNLLEDALTQDFENKRESNIARVLRHNGNLNEELALKYFHKLVDLKPFDQRRLDNFFSHCDSSNSAATCQPMMAKAYKYLTENNHSYAAVMKENCQKRTSEACNSVFNKGES